MKLSKWAKMKGISLQTAYRWFHKGLIPNAVQIDTKTILVDCDDNFDFNINQNKTSIKNELNNSQDKNVVVYCRVSSHNKKDDLIRQIERCSQFAFNLGLPVTKTYKEISSGMNDNRKQLWKMIESNPDVIIVENKDRLTRFGFNYIDRLLQKQNCKIIVINKSTENETDLIQDMISIVTSFCCRLYGLRRGSVKGSKIKSIALDNTDVVETEIIDNG